VQIGNKEIHLVDVVSHELNPVHYSIHSLGSQTYIEIGADDQVFRSKAQCNISQCQILRGDVSQRDALPNRC